MKIRIKATGDVMNVVPSAEFNVMLKEGRIEIVKEPVFVPKPIVHETKWIVTCGPSKALPPHIFASCTGCVQTARFLTPTPKSMFLHSGKNEQVPTDVYEQWERLNEMRFVRPKARDRKPRAV